MVDTHERLAEFWRKYNFPDDVKVSYCPESEVILSKGVIPPVAIVKGGVRIPMTTSLLTSYTILRSTPTNVPLTFLGLLVVYMFSR